MPTHIDSHLVSVIIPVHNRSTELRRAIGSVLKQTHSNFEVLVMDDASTEDLKSVVQSFNDPRILIFHHEKKSNANVMRNEGLKKANGEFIALLDSDDEFLPEHIAEKLKELNESGADGAYGSSFIDDGSKRTYTPSREMVSNLTAVEYLLTIGFAPTPSWVIKKEKALQIMFDESLLRHQDYDFFVRFEKKFKWFTSWHPGIVIHWRSGEKRHRHPGSEIQFVRNNARDISPRIYADYHLTQLGLYFIENAPSSIIDYYRYESKRYVMQLSFLDYCSMYPNRKGAASFIINWIGFAALIFVRKFTKPREPLVPIDTKA